MMRDIIDVEIEDISTLKDLPLLNVYGAGYFLDRPVPDSRWLIPGLIPLGIPACLASKGGLGKSFLALQSCVAQATGLPFLDYEAQPPMGSVYFGLEDSQDTFHKRFRSVTDFYRSSPAWTQEHEEALRRNLAVPYINWKAQGATSYLPTLVPNLEMILETNQANGIRPGGFVLDTLARISEGDENTVQALRPILNACQRICDNYGYTPLVLHHVGKGQDGARTKDKPSLSDRMSPEWVRGTSAIVDNFRCILQLAQIREDEAESAGLDPERARLGQYLVFGATKLNGGQRGDWRFLEQDEHGRWFTPQNGPEILARLRGRRALTELSKQTALLVDLWQTTRCGAEPDREALAAKHCGEASDPQRSLRQMIHKLRNLNYIQKTSLCLTVSGTQHAIGVTRGNANA